MPQSFPFIYISGLPRTGTTLLSEALSLLPYSFIFHEPNLGKNTFSVHDQDYTQLSICKIDLFRFVNARKYCAFLYRRLKSLGVQQDFFVKEFKFNLLPELRKCVRQVGVKEIKHRGWENYLLHFPDMKVITLARDPRDIYISYFRMWKKGNIAWKGDFTAATMTEFLKREFAYQLAIHNYADHIQIRYEDLCSDKSVFNGIKNFVGSPIPGKGEIGKFIRNHPRRVDESKIHHNQITSKRIYAWKTEQNTRLLEQAHAFFYMVSEYSKYWGYS